MRQNTYIHTMIHTARTKTNFRIIHDFKPKNHQLGKRENSKNAGFTT